MINSREILPFNKVLHCHVAMTAFAGHVVVGKAGLSPVPMDFPAPGRCQRRDIDFPDCRRQWPRDLLGKMFVKVGVGREYMYMCYLCNKRSPLLSTHVKII